jgi:hypothetical protein
LGLHLPTLPCLSSFQQSGCIKFALICGRHTSLFFQHLSLIFCLHKMTLEVDEASACVCRYTLVTM